MQMHEQYHLLRLSAEVIRAVVLEHPIPPMSFDSWSGPARGGAFVTLRTGGQLRGCVGTFDTSQPLPRVISEMTEAAMEDSRFENDRISPGELAELEIEISVVSPLVRTAAPLAMQIGTHGVYVRARGRTGCFLPKVAVEAGWDAEALLNRLCEMKLRVPAHAWREADAEVSLFTTETFCASWAALEGEHGSASRGEI